MARKSFFVCQAKAAQIPPNRDTVDFYALDVPQFDHQLMKGQISLSLIRRPIQAATPDSLQCPPLLPCLLASCDPAVRFNIIVSFTNLIETRNCAAFAIALEPMARRWLTPVRVTFLNKINDPPTKLHRKWLAYQ